MLWNPSLLFSTRAGVWDLKTNASKFTKIYIGWIALQKGQSIYSMYSRVCFWLPDFLLVNPCVVCLLSGVDWWQSHLMSIAGIELWFVTATGQLQGSWSQSRLRPILHLLLWRFFAKRSVLKDSMWGKCDSWHLTRSPCIQSSIFNLRLGILGMNKEGKGQWNKGPCPYFLLFISLTNAE